MVIEIPSQSGVTQDNATILIDGVLYMQVVDPIKVRAPAAIQHIIGCRRRTVWITTAWP